MNRIVIARYSENLDWVREIPAAFEIHIVNKGPPLTDPALRLRAAAIRDRPNEGRESETYLTYMMEAAATGTDGHTVFAQGDPLEHSPDFLDLLRGHAAWAEIQPLSWRWRPARQIPPPTVLAREQADYLGGARLRPELFSLATWSPLGFSDPGTQWLETRYRDLHRLPQGSNIAAHFLAICGLPALAIDAERHLLGRFAYGALFAVHHRRLAALDRAALAHLRQAALGHEVYGYMLERLWLHLCGENFVLPAPIGDAQATPPTGAIGQFAPPDPRGKLRRKLHSVTRRLGVSAQSR